MTVQKNWEEFLVTRTFDEVVKISIKVIQQFNEVLRENQNLKQQLAETKPVDENNNVDEPEIHCDNGTASEVYNLQVPVVVGRPESDLDNAHTDTPVTLVIASGQRGDEEISVSVQETSATEE